MGGQVMVVHWIQYEYDGNEISPFVFHGITCCLGNFFPLKGSNFKHHGEGVNDKAVTTAQ